MVLGLPFGARAENINLSVEVVKRLPTDTINDFDFSTVNQTYSDSGTASSADSGVVKGAGTSSPTVFNWSFVHTASKWFLRLVSDLL